MNTNIRLAVPADEQALAELNVFVHEFHLVNNPLFFKPTTLEEIVAYFRGLIDDPTVRIWIAEQGGTAVGYASVFLRERPENPFCRARRWLDIDHIGVRPECQRRGIGRRLVEHVLQEARKEGIRDVELNSRCFNHSAHEAFRRLGFAPRLIRFGREASEAHD